MKHVTTNSKAESISRLKSWGLKPLVLDFYIQQVWPTFSFERVFAKVVETYRMTLHTRTLVLKPNFNFKNFKAGQHVLVTVDIGGQRLTRTYSPTMQNDGRLEITVKEVPEGKVSSEINNALKVGSIIEISQAFGDLNWETLPKSSHYTFCAAGVGITPLRSLIDSWSKKSSLNQQTQIELHYWAKTESELCFTQGFKVLEKQHPKLKIYLYTTREPSAGNGSAKINASLFSNNKTVFVACGPESFVHEAENIAREKQQVCCSSYSQNLKREEASNSTQEEFYEITYGDKVIQASSQKTILESLENSGLKPVHGCRMGICKTCTCMKNSGVALNIKDKTISNETNEEIQICVSKPRSKMTLKEY